MRSFSVAAAPAVIVLMTRSKSSLAAVTSVVTASSVTPTSLLAAAVSASNSRPVPRPAAGTPEVVWVRRASGLTALAVASSSSAWRRRAGAVGPRPTLAPVISSSLLVSSNATSGPAACPRVAPLAMITEVVKVGLVPKTAAPAPVSSERTPASWALVVAAKTLRLSDGAGRGGDRRGGVREGQDPGIAGGGQGHRPAHGQGLAVGQGQGRPGGRGGQGHLVERGRGGHPEGRGGEGGAGGEDGGP